MHSQEVRFCVTTAQLAPFPQQRRALRSCVQDANQKTPAKLKHFVETQVKNGGYADEVTATAGIRVASST
jgi:hypothetical protein